MDPSFEEDLVRINIPDAGHYRLVEKEAFQAAFPASHNFMKRFEIKAQRLRPKVPQLTTARRFGRPEITDETKLPDIAKA